MDLIEPLQRYGTQLLCAVEASLCADDLARLRALEARGGALLLSMSLNGEVWVSAVLDGRTVGVPWWLSPRGVALTMGLPPLPVQPADAGA